MADQDRELKNALAAIEKQFGKGAIMQLGEQLDARRAGHPHRRLEPRHRPGRQGSAARPDHRNLRPGIERQDHRGPAHHRQRPEARAAWRPSSTPSTPSIPSWAKRSASIWKACSSASRPTARKRSRSPRCWSNRTPWTSSSSTRWPPWCRGPRSKAKSATRTSACKPAS